MISKELLESSDLPLNGGKGNIDSKEGGEARFNHPNIFNLKPKDLKEGKLHACSCKEGDLLKHCSPSTTNSQIVSFPGKIPIRGDGMSMPSIQNKA